jgi:deoxyribose-phosphate aldolase
MDDVRPVQAAGGETAAGAEESVEEFAKKIDYEILQAALTEKQLYNACLVARQHGLGSVVVRPCDADSALRFLSLGVVKVASTVGHPFGSSNTGVKVYEARDLLRRGVKQIWAYPNPGKLFSRQFQHQEVELIQLADSCLESGGVLKIVADTAMLDEEMKIILCRMAKRVNAHYVAASEPKDLELFLKYCGELVKVECGGIETLAQARLAFAAGCERIVSRNPEAILTALAAERAARAATTSPQG